jgi:hypothetical protein
VIAIDTNILVYSHRKDSPFHRSAFEAVRAVTASTSPWGLPWPCIHEFLANVTHPRIYRTPTPLRLALDQVEQWLSSPSIVPLAEEEGYWAAFRPLVESSQVAGAKVHDARIAALCIYHGVSELWTADRDFSRFSRLPIRNPLTA